MKKEENGEMVVMILMVEICFLKKTMKGDYLIILNLSLPKNNEISTR